MNKSSWWQQCLRVLAIAVLVWSICWPLQPVLAARQKSLSTKEMRELVSGGLTGNYAEDTNAVVKSLRYAITLPKDAPDKSAAQQDAKYKINAFASRYRRDGDKLRLTSFTTLRTALNSLASYYNSTAKRRVPDKVRDRVLVELDRVELALAQGD
ncbi:MAG: photosystem II protein Psb27 [Pseudanabaenaceae cyanobacterium bins.68]|nr:photosystem II protein Psb27 [Pseudanabaenaceae cyanobacterium bins.68]